MAPIKIFVGNIPPHMTNSELEDLFRKYGRVDECDILNDFGFVHMRYTSDGRAAIADLDGTHWRGSRLRVEVSTTSSSKHDRTPRRYVISYGMILFIYLKKRESDLTERAEEEEDGRTIDEEVARGLARAHELELEPDLDLDLDLVRAPETDRIIVAIDHVLELL